jgi:hypothetical protein
MQAFLWRHLVPAGELLAAVLPGKARVPPVSRIGGGTVEVPAGGEAVVRFRVPAWTARQGVEVVAVEAPDGLALRCETRLPDELAVHLTADAAKLKPGATDNLLLGVMLQPGPLAKEAKKPARARAGAAPVAVMPAVPVTIVKDFTKP